MERKKEAHEATDRWCYPQSLRLTGEDWDSSQGVDGSLAGISPDGSGTYCE